MRITCPSCGAQYEVTEGAIPTGGRDVQCSACGHVWPVGGEAEEPPAEAGQGPAVKDAQDLPSEPESEPEPEPEAGPEPDASGPVAAPRRPALSPEVTAILREEAERERARREAERQARQVTAQPELGLDAAMGPVRRRADEAREHMARLRAQEPAAPPESAPVESASDVPISDVVSETQTSDEVTQEAGPNLAQPGASSSRRGRERLPDIEEINASLRAATERAPAHVSEHEVPPARAGGFRAGFLGMIALACLALAAYLGAPRIAESVPSVAPQLGRYVEGVDSLRIWLDRQVQGILPAEDGVNE